MTRNLLLTLTAAMLIFAMVLLYHHVTCRPLEVDVLDFIKINLPACEAGSALPHKGGQPYAFTAI